jgi:hypothetical protein
LKQEIVDAITDDKERFLECYKAQMGQCFYVTIYHGTHGPYGDRIGAAFRAYRDLGARGTERTYTLIFEVTGTVAASHRIVGPFKDFIRDNGLRRLRDRLDSGATTAEDQPERILLNSSSPHSEFENPPDNRSVLQIRRIREDVMNLLAQAAEPVPKANLLRQICGTEKRLDQALKILVDTGQVTISNGAAELTSAGHVVVETAASVQAQSASVSPGILRASPQYDIFLSHAGEDRGLADQLRRALDARGFKVWLDMGELTIGDTLTAKIEAGLRQSRYGLLLLSEAFLSKPWPQAELSALLHRHVSSAEKVLLPIRVGITHAHLAERHPLLADIYTGDFTTTDTVVDEIVRAIGVPRGPAA